MTPPTDPTKASSHSNDATKKHSHWKPKSFVRGRDCKPFTRSRGSRDPVKGTSDDRRQLFVIHGVKIILIPITRVMT